jgi:large subunit ribosomal protein L30
MADTTPKMLKIRQVKSSIGTVRTHREVLRGLGLRRIRHEVLRQDTPAVRGAVKKIEYMVEIVEETS